MCILLNDLSIVVVPRTHNPYRVGPIPTGRTEDK
jgi:hypothetical protein